MKGSRSTPSSIYTEFEIFPHSTCLLWSPPSSVKGLWMMAYWVTEHMGTFPQAMLHSSPGIRGPPGCPGNTKKLLPCLWAWKKWRRVGEPFSSHSPDVLQKGTWGEREHLPRQGLEAQRVWRGGTKSIAFMDGMIFMFHIANTRGQKRDKDGFSLGSVTGQRRSLDLSAWCSHWGLEVLLSPAAHMHLWRLHFCWQTQDTSPNGL